MKRYEEMLRQVLGMACDEGQRQSILHGMVTAPPARGEATLKERRRLALKYGWIEQKTDERAA